MKSAALFTTLAFAATAVAAASPAAAPVQEPEAAIVHSDFSFTAWVDSVIADPENALSPEEAVAAFNAGLSTLEKRQTFGNCQQLGDRPAQVPDAVWCINDLAARGRAGQNCDVNSSSRAQCTHNVAQIVTVRGRDDAPSSVNCNDIARAGGLIMDRCTRGDNTVSGQAYIPQGGVAVHIQMPLI
ncbi:uncharacterized protein K460DRAFT_366272 [Cucurbitaria berberidis CBS 394.84]|uniref:Ecp2 effector protein domain-containing protein n=1 Tax=Cucurbitaria berberidis CBS 394.84 TaxID=1168544 RepID=A0A9P4GG02_9PLEO|nr:uncharacterized protein K460DRAFT_366272 [Cucurbitaria berberidis CBS 394.84]KAF1845383.1 hypothetical protein K460DRAFT_366272 [Cucurbitaria berberidis CBS 394.84]